MQTEETKCRDCKTEFQPTGISTGYGTDRHGRRYCFTCCGMYEADKMDADGKATLYLAKVDMPENPANTIKTKPYRYEVTNWPGTLRIKVASSKTGHHNIAGSRIDVWFRFNGQYWHGVQYGENTQICHCKRIKAESYWR